ncbi:MAG: restriction endonuclease subunit S [Candidatus Neomarinimicrobiota bacterium]
MNTCRFRSKQLENILAFKNGKSIKPGGIGKYPVYGSNGIIGGCDEYKEQNGIILGRVGAYCGSVSYYPGKFWASDNTIVVYPKSTEYDVLYLSYLLRELNLNRWAGGAAQPLLTQTVLKQVEAPVPPLPTQRKIAAILSAYDDLIENNLRRIKILEEMAQNLYREWFVKFRFPGHQHARFTDSVLGRIPEGWEVVTVEQIVERVPSGKKYDQKTVSVTGTVPVLDQGRSGIIGYHNDEPGVLASEDTPIIVFANHTCYQRFVMFSFSAIQNVLPFLTNSEYPRNIYWLHYATKDLVTFNDYKGHWPEFMAKELFLPSSNTCQQFVGFVEPITRLIYKMEKRNETLRRTRDLLLPRLISGEVDVSELDIKIEESA